MPKGVIERFRAGDESAIDDLVDWWAETVMMYGGQASTAYLTAGIFARSLEDWHYARTIKEVK